MTTVPSTRLGKIEFYEAHAPVWTARAAQIGLTPAQTTLITALAQTARDAYDAHVAAINAARAATADFHNKADVLHSAAGAGADMIRDIRHHALSTSNPNVYVLAEIPPPKTPGQSPPPAKPEDFTLTVEDNGALTIRWKCANPAGTQGTSYEVLRSVDGGPPQFVTNTGKKFYTDGGVPAGSGLVDYLVTAIRADLKSPVAVFTVRLGVGGATAVESAAV